MLSLSADSILQAELTDTETTARIFYMYYKTWIMWKFKAIENRSWEFWEIYTHPQIMICRQLEYPRLNKQIPLVSYL